MYFVLLMVVILTAIGLVAIALGVEIGRASCRERV